MTALKTAEIDRFLARPDPARPIVLVYGPDAGLVRERVDALVKASVDDVSDPFAFVRIEGDDLSANPARLVEEAHTVPLFGGRRAVLV
jgi:DNA polymerase-3 subunit delta